MRRFLSKYGFTLAIIAILVVVCFVFFNFLYFNNLVNQNQTKLIEIFTRQVNAKTGFVLTVDKISAEFPFLISFSNVKLDDDEGQRILDVKNVIVKADWIKIIRNSDRAVSAIRYIELDEPVVHTTVKDGKIGLLEKLSKKRLGKTTINWNEVNLKLVIDSGSAEITLVKKDNSREETFPLPFQLQGEIIIADNKLVLYPKLRILLPGVDASGKPEKVKGIFGSQASKFLVIGGNGDLEGNIRLTGDLDLKGIQDYWWLIRKLYKPLKDWEIKLGSSRGKIKINLKDIAGATPSFEAEVQLDTSGTSVKPLKVDIPEIVINDGMLRYSFPQNNLDFKFNGKSADAFLKGEVLVNDIARGEIKGGVEAVGIPVDALPLDFLPRSVKIDGKIDASVWFGGKISDPTISGEITSNSILINKKSFQIKDSLFIYTQGRLSFPKLKLDDNSGGSIDVIGFSQIVERESSYNIEVTGLVFPCCTDYAGFGLPFNVEGNPHIVASIFAKPKEFSSKINLGINEGKIEGIPVSDLRGAISVYNNDVDIEEVVFTPSGGGRVRTSGRVELPNKMDLKVEFAESKLTGLSNIASSGIEAVDGTLFGGIDISGTFSNPVVQASLKAYDVRINEWKYDQASIDFDIDSSGLKKGRAIFSRTGSNVEVHAEYLFKNDRPMTLWGKWKNIPLGAIVGESFKSNIMISGQGEFTGDAENLNGIVSVSLDGEDSFGNHVSTPQDQVFTGTFLDISLAGIGKIKAVDELGHILSNGNSGGSQGGVIKGGELNIVGGLEFDSVGQVAELQSLLAVLKKDILPRLPETRIDLLETKIPQKRVFPLDGFLDTTLSIERKGDSWLLNGSANAKSFKIQNDPVGVLNAKIETVENGNYDVALKFSQGGGDLEVKGQVKWEEVTGSSPMDLTMSVDSYPLESIARLVGIESQKMFSGFLNGTGRVSGTPLAPRLENINLSFKDAQLFGIPVTGENLVFSWSGTRITCENFELDGTGGFHLAASGFIELDRTKFSQSRIDLRLDNLKLQDLSTGKFLPAGLGGSLSVITQIGYDQITQTPQIYMDLVLDKPEFMGVELDRVTGQAIMDGSSGDIKIGKMSGSLGESTFKLNGKIHPDVDLKSAKIDLNTSSDNFDFIPVLKKFNIPLVSDDAHLSLNMHIGGSMQNPILDGHIEMGIASPRLEDVRIADRVGISMNIKNNRIELGANDVVIENNGASLSATGTIDFGLLFSGNGNFRPGQRLGDLVKIDIINNDQKPFPIDNFGMTVKVLLKGKEPNKNLHISLANGNFLLSGTVEIVEGHYSVTAIPQPKEKKATSPVELDIDVLFPAGFPITSGNNLDIRLRESRFNISGSPTYPSADGTLVVESGKLRLLDRTFNIEEATLQFRPFLGIDNPYLKGRASTVIIAQSIRNLAGTENLRVTAQIDARLRQLTSGIQFTSNRGTLTEDELMGIMMRQDLFQDFQEEGLLTTLSQQAFTIPGAFLSRYFEKKGGFQSFQIGVDFDNDIFVSFEYETFKDWFFDFYYLFSTTTALNTGIKYRFRQDSFVGIATDEEGSIILKIDYVIPLK